MGNRSERHLAERIRDFERALALPGGNERLQFARRVLPNGASVKARLLSMINRSMKEEETHARLIDQAHALGNPSLEFAERSRMYRDRGLASDTSVRINFAIEEALQRIVAAGLIARARRVAVIGPGLDVVDKQEGHDFYPPQTIQPFAVIDSLVRAGLAEVDTVTVTTLDVSARVNDHIGADSASRTRGSALRVTPSAGRQGSLVSGAAALFRQLRRGDRQCGSGYAAARYRPVAIARNRRASRRSSSASPRAI